MMLRLHSKHWLLLAFTSVLPLGCQDSTAKTNKVTATNNTQYAGITPTKLTLVVDNTTVTVTPAAKTELQKLIAEMDPNDTYYLRVSGELGGCTGVIHKLDLDVLVTAEDYAFETDGVKVVMERKSIDLLRGAQIDYVSGINVKGFKVTYPTREAEAKKKAAANAEQTPE